MLESDFHFWEPLVLNIPAIYSSIILVTTMGTFNVSGGGGGLIEGDGKSEGITKLSRRAILPVSISLLFHLVSHD